MAALLDIPAAVNQNLAAIVPSTAVNGTYLYLLLEFNYRKLRDIGRGSNQDALNTKLVGDFQIPLPPYSEQLACVHAASQADLRIALEEDRLRKLQDLNRALAGDLLTGIIRTDVGEDAAS
jgi:type I restriction enzyme, S subunit